jgi:hypothetical protein
MLCSISRKLLLKLRLIVGTCPCRQTTGNFWISPGLAPPRASRLAVPTRSRAPRLLSTQLEEDRRGPPRTGGRGNPRRPPRFYSPSKLGTWLHCGHELVDSIANFFPR